MKKILGLDLGTNSIGWAVVERENHQDAKGGVRDIIENYTLKDKGVLIFSEGVKIEKGNESSKAAERTEYRSARRIKFRRKLRKYETLKALIDYNMCPLRSSELENWKSSVDSETGKKRRFKDYPSSIEFREWLHTDSTSDIDENKKQIRNPYYLRARSLDHKLSSHELGRIMYHFAQRRGFLSNRLDSSDTSLLESVMPEIQRIIDESDSRDILYAELDDFYENFDMKDDENKDLKKLQRSFYGILKNSDALSFSELKRKLDERLNRKENLGAVKMGISELSDEIEKNGMRTMGEYFYSCYKDGKKIRNRYTAREDHYLNEFNAICEAQGVPSSLRVRLERAIFFQRPLKSQKGTVGRCSLEPSKARCPISHPDYEEFRMLSFINNIKVRPPGEEGLRPLNKEERAKVIEKFERKKPSFPFEDLAKALAPKDRYAYFKSDRASGDKFLFNYQMNASISGCPTSSLLKSIFEKKLSEISFTYRTLDRDGIEVQRHVDYHDLWNILFTFTDKEKLRAFAENKLALDNKKARQFANARLKQDYASLSLKAIRNILPFLRAGSIYSHAVFMGKLPQIIDKEKWQGNEAYINEAINELIANDKEENRLNGIANDLFAQYKSEYGNAHKDYALDNDDHSSILNRIHEVYGVKRFESKPKEEKDAIIKEVEMRFLTSLKEGKFRPRLRLDEKVIAFIIDNDLCEDPSRLNDLYHPSDIETYPKPKRDKDGRLYLASPMTKSVRNPMAMRALHQLRALVNTLIKEGVIDEDTHINIELARELNDANKRKALQAWQNRLRDEKEAAAEEIIKLFKEECGGDSVVPNEMDVLKFKLWTEQGKKCVYTGKTIGICDFVGADPLYDIEHTLPRSISEDNSDMNLTLCERKYNREVKKNRIPSNLPDYESILLNVDQWRKKYLELEDEMAMVTKRVRAASDKKSKDKHIERRHLLRLECDYYRGKYERFAMKEIKAGFKNSQKVDIGIISKLSRAYLESVFPRVNSVKGTMVAEFRKIWGLQEFERDENGGAIKDVYGLPVYREKDRSNHCHHCQDAVVIACMSKQKYDVLAKVWGLQERGELNDARRVLGESKPWESFTQDVKAIPDEVLVVHHSPDNVGKKAKRKWKKRGKVQRNGNGQPIYLQGDVARGSLHKDSFYGAILRPELHAKTGQPLSDKDGNEVRSIRFVKREALSILKDADIKNIVDERVRNIVAEGRQKEKALRSEIKRLEKEIKSAEVIEEQTFQSRITDIKDTIENRIYVLPNANGKPIPIKKVRRYANDVKTPLELKAHSHPSRHEHKKHYAVKNDENYAMAIYEFKSQNKTVRKSVLMNLLDASKVFKESGAQKDTAFMTRIQEKGKNYPLKVLLRKGLHVLLYDKEPEELRNMPTKQLMGRLFTITQLDIEGSGIKLKHNQEARENKEITSHMGLKTGMKGGKNLDDYRAFPWIKLGANGFDGLVENEDFTISKSGNICFKY